MKTCPNCDQETVSEYCSTACFEAWDTKRAIIRHFGEALVMAASLSGFTILSYPDPKKGILEVRISKNDEWKTIRFSITDMSIKTY